MLVEANGTGLYVERRGNGPAVLLVSGATGDAGHWTAVAEELADSYTVVTYDRRGNSRSPRPAGWSTTTMAEQADDAAALIDALDLAPAVAVGTSAAAGIVAELCLRRADLLRGAVLHDPLFPSGVPDPEAVRAGRQALVARGMAAGGPRVAGELFLRSVAGDATYEGIDPSLRERMLGNAEVLFAVELAAFVPYDVDPGRLRATGVPCVVAAGAAGRDPAAPGHWRYAVARWTAGGLDTEPVDLPGGHMAYLGEPAAFAAALRPALARFDV